MSLNNQDVIKLVDEFKQAVKKESRGAYEFIAIKFAKGVIKCLRQGIDIYEDMLKAAIDRARKDYEFYFFLCLLVDAGNIIVRRDFSITDEYVNFEIDFMKRYGALYYFEKDLVTPEPLDIPKIMNFIDPSRRQSPLGKQPIELRKTPYLPHQLVYMRWPYHQFDADKNTFYFLSGKKGDESKSYFKVTASAEAMLKRPIDKEYIPEGEYFYVLTYKGSLYAFNGDDIPEVEGVRIKLHHSSVRAGQYVGCAGHIIVNKDGKIIRINADSGHMKPRMENLITAIIWLYEEKKYIDLDCIVEFKNDYIKDSEGNGITGISINDLINSDDLVFNNPELSDFRARHRAQPKPY